MLKQIPIVYLVRVGAQEEFRARRVSPRPPSLEMLFDDICESNESFHSAGQAYRKSMQLYDEIAKGLMLWEMCNAQVNDFRRP